MTIHILGICGTFMGSLAVLAKQMGIDVVGTDAQVYPPMSTQLAQQGIDLREGFAVDHFAEAVDQVIVGNAMKRDNPMVEHMLNAHMPYTSGPQWLAEQVLSRYHVLAVSGTHGKTTTASMLAWILEYAGLKPGFLIGGVPENFGVSARLGEGDYFVIEADEYDSAFFDKRAKFVHYRPDTLIINNLEFDHADIYPDLAAIQRQFHHLIRMIPSQGSVIIPQQDTNVHAVLEQGCWTPVITINGADATWQVEVVDAAGSDFAILQDGQPQARVQWDLLGMHNVHNALAATVAAHQVGVDVATAAKALMAFRSVKRRMEVRGEINHVTVYDDFAHHPTAIATTLQGLRAKVGEKGRILAVLEFGSYTMRSGCHNAQVMLESLQGADQLFFMQRERDAGDLSSLLQQLDTPHAIYETVDDLATAVCQQSRAGDHVLIMSNTGFGGAHDKILNGLQAVSHD